MRWSRFGELEECVYGAVRILSAACTQRTYPHLYVITSYNIHGVYRGSGVYGCYIRGRTRRGENGLRILRIFHSIYSLSLLITWNDRKNSRSYTRYEIRRRFTIALSILALSLSLSVSCSLLLPFAGRYENLRTPIHTQR